MACNYLQKVICIVAVHCLICIFTSLMKIFKSMKMRRNVQDIGQMIVFPEPWRVVLPQVLPETLPCLIN